MFFKINLFESKKSFFYNEIEEKDPQFLNGGDFMATKSFTNKGFKIDAQNASEFHNIMNDKKKMRIRKVKGHKTVRTRREMKKLLGL